MRGNIAKQIGGGNSPVKGTGKLASEGRELYVAITAASLTATSTSTGKTTLTLRMTSYIGPKMRTDQGYLRAQEKNFDQKLSAAVDVCETCSSLKIQRGQERRSRRKRKKRTTCVVAWRQRRTQ